MVDPTTGTPVIPNAVAFGDPANDGNGIWVAVCNKGTRMRSINRGVSWETTNWGYDDADDLKGVTYGNGMFVAVGKSGAVLTSPDGVAWARQTIITNSALNAVVFGEGVFVAVGTVATAPNPAMATIITSTNGAQWFARRLPATTTEKLTSVAYGKGQFVATGSATLVSGSGTTWTGPVTTGETGVMNAIASGENRFVAISASGSAYTNDTDPKEAAWSKWMTGILGFPAAGTTANIVNGIAFFKDTFIAVGSDSKLLTSPDGRSWTERASLTSNFLYGVTYGKNIYVAVGWGGKILTSTDSITWEEQTSGISGSFFGVAFGEDIFVAVGSGGKIVTSPDGKQWTSRSSRTSKTLFAVAYGKGVFVAAGADGAVTSSSDGLSWRLRDSKITTHLFGISFVNNRFVAVGEKGKVLTTTSGLTWYDKTPSYESYPAESLYGATYGGSVFVVVGENGRILTTPDLSTWTKVNPVCVNALRAVTYANDLFVALGSGGKILTSVSPQGAAWTAKTSGINYSLLGMVKKGDTLVVVGAYATILSSEYSDEAQWTLWTIRSSGTYKQLKAVAYGYNTYVAVGEAGTVLTSKNGLLWDLKTVPLVSWFNGVAYSKGNCFVAVGDYGGYGRVCTSTDGGRNWQISFPKAQFPSTSLSGVRYGNSRFVAAGANGIELVSWDNDSYGTAGSWWNEMYLEADYSIRSIAYGNRNFVMVGAPNRTFLTSTVPEDYWIIRWAPFFPQEISLGFNGIAYGAGIFTVVGPKVKIGVSTDNAVRWRQVPLEGYKGTFDFTGITFGGDTSFTAVGTYGKILTSPNGEDWTFRSSKTTVDLNSVVYGSKTTGSSYVIVGKNGTILQSGPIQN